MVLPSGGRAWRAWGSTDMRKSMDGVAGRRPQGAGGEPSRGALVAFRGKRGGLVKLLWFDGQGLCLFSKRLERGYFPVAGHRHGAGFADARSAVDVTGRH